MPKDLTQTHGRQIWTLATGKLAALVVQFCFPMFLVRFLSKSEYGIYAQFNMFVGLFIGLLGLALASSIYYFHPRLEKRAIRAMLGNSFLIFLLVCIATWIIMFRTPCGEWMMGTSGVMAYMPYMFLVVFSGLCAQIIVPLYVVMHDIKTSLYYPTMEILIRVTMVVMLAYWIGGIKGVILGVVISSGIILIYVGWYTYNRTRELEDRHWFNFPLLKEQLNYTWPFACSGALGTIVGRLDKLICVSFMSTSEYAIYVVAFLSIPGIEQVYTSIGEVYLTGMSQCFKNHDPAGALKLLKTLEFKAVSFSFPVVFAVCLYADKIITLIYSEKYLDSIPYFRVFIFALLFQILASGLIVRASGQTRICLYTSLISIAVVVPVTFWGIKYYGAWGGIFSVMLGRLVQRFAYAFYEIKIVNSTWKDYLPWKQFGIIFSISFLLVLPLVLLRHFVDLNVFVCGALSCVYIAAVYLLEIHLEVFVVDRTTSISLLNKYLKKVGLH